MTKDEFLNIACDHYNKELQGRRITSSQIKEYEANLDSFNNSLNDIRQRLNVKLKSNGVCSEFLINQLARHACSLGEIFENKNTADDFKFVEFYNALEILDILELLETENIIGEQFKRQPLSGLYKTHHNSHGGRGYSLIRNIKNYWFAENNKLLPKRENEFNNIVEQTGLGSNKIAELMNKMHDKVYSKDLTGEWIVHAKHNNIKYYLCLALHDEGDNNIYENKIKTCYDQFPELTQK